MAQRFPRSWFDTNVIFAVVALASRMLAARIWSREIEGREEYYTGG
jgi:hypothetical protein